MAGTGGVVLFSNLPNMKKLYFILFTFIFSCNTYVERNNDQEDVNEAEQLTNNFYRMSATGDYTELYRICDKDLDIEGLKATLTQRDSLLGTMSNYEVKQIETRYAKTDGIDSTEYAIETLSHYKNGEALETLRFVKRSDKETVVKGYYLKIAD
jgi:hypothetical protein